MSWKKLLDQGRVERHATSAEELVALRAVVERNLADASVEAISPDARFGCAYEAALILATAAIACSGYRVKGLRHHRSTFEALPFALSGKVSVSVELAGLHPPPSCNRLNMFHHSADQAGLALQPPMHRLPSKR